MARTNGGPAFPRPGHESLTYEDLGSDGADPQEGMSLRDYFAAHAPPMLDEWAAFRRYDMSPNDSPEQELRLMAEWAWAYADAMIARRRK